MFFQKLKKKIEEVREVVVVMVVVWLGTCLGGLGVQASKVLPKIFGGR